jgi:hypothetical protein
MLSCAFEEFENLAGLLEGVTLPKGHRHGMVLRISKEIGEESKSN